MDVNHASFRVFTLQIFFYLANTSMFFNAICKNKILAIFFEFTVSRKEKSNIELTAKTEWKYWLLDKHTLLNLQLSPRKKSSNL